MDLMLQEEGTLEEYELSLNVTDEAKDVLAGGFSEEYGARPAQGNTPLSVEDPYF